MAKLKGPATFFRRAECALVEKMCEHVRLVSEATSFDELLGTPPFEAQLDRFSYPDGRRHLRALLRMLNKARENLAPPTFLKAEKSLLRLLEENREGQERSNHLLDD